MEVDASGVMLGHAMDQAERVMWSSTVGRVKGRRKEKGGEKSTRRLDNRETREGKRERIKIENTE